MAASANRKCSANRAVHAAEPTTLHETIPLFHHRRLATAHPDSDSSRCSTGSSSRPASGRAIGGSAAERRRGAQGVSDPRQEWRWQSDQRRDSQPFPRNHHPRRRGWRRHRFLRGAEADDRQTLRYEVKARRRSGWPATRRRATAPASRGIRTTLSAGTMGFVGEPRCLHQRRLDEGVGRNGKNLNRQAAKSANEQMKNRENEKW